MSLVYCSLPVLERVERRVESGSIFFDDTTPVSYMISERGRPTLELEGNCEVE